MALQVLLVLSCFRLELEQELELQKLGHEQVRELGPELGQELELELE